MTDSFATCMLEDGEMHIQHLKSPMKHIRHHVAKIDENWMLKAPKLKKSRLRRGGYRRFRRLMDVTLFRVRRFQKS